MASRLDIKDMREIAQLRGGKCLSKNYIDQYEPLKWMCERGHTWDAPYTIIQQGGWCRQCARGNQAKQSFEFYQKLAQSKGGKLLSEKYTNSHIPLKWQCAKGHVWKAKSYSVKNLKSWCPKCSHAAAAVKRRLPIKEFIAIAESRGGKLLSKKYINIETHLQWECAKGHRWMTTPLTIKNGSWCPYCASRVKLTLTEMKKMAKAKGGRCLSSKYFDGQSKLKWKCGEGHIWQAPPSRIKHGGSWCPYCAGKVKHTIAEMKILARAKKGKCLSSDYISNSTKLKWQCGKGHIWKTVPKIILNGGWCPVCYGRLKGFVKGKLTIKTSLYFNSLLFFSGTMK